MFEVNSAPNLQAASLRMGPVGAFTPLGAGTQVVRSAQAGACGRV